MSFSFRRAKPREDEIVDRVTGAFNRRQLDVDIASGVDTSGRSTATLMIDVDRFESFDGRKGNAKGDQVLERVAWVIMATVRTTDVVYRHEASTFCVLLPATSDTDATIVAERIRGNVAKMPLLAEYGVSVTVGVAVGPSGDVREAVERAIQALDREVQRRNTRVIDESGDDDASTAAIDDPFIASLTPSAERPLVRPSVAPVDALYSAPDDEGAEDAEDHEAHVGQSSEVSESA